MRVLHFQHMGAGVVISEALRRIGVDSHVVSTCEHPFGFEAEIMPSRRYLGRVPVLRKIVKLHDWKRYFGYDILHSHDNMPPPSFVVSHYRGRLIQHYHDPKTAKPLYASNAVSFVSVPTILGAIPNGVWIPLPSDTILFNPQKKIKHNNIRVGFCDQQLDSNKAQFIPKREIMEAIDFGKGIHPAPLCAVTPHEFMPEYYGEIDIWVDRFGLDFYGFAAVEAAAMGIPVITQIREAEKTKWVSSCPFINTGRKGIANAITYLASHEDMREELGRKCRDFVLKIHDSTIVAKQCLHHYEEVLGEPGK